MKYDLAVAVGGGGDLGLGHAMRGLAIVEAAMRTKAKVAVILVGHDGPPHPDLFDLPWPCAVLVPGRGETPLRSDIGCVVSDCPGDRRTVTPMDESSTNFWQILDGEPDDAPAWLTGWIWPHFGAHPLGKPTLYGPTWMPLRGTSPRRTSPGLRKWASYRADTANVGRILLEDLAHGAVLRIFRERVDFAVLPPSTIAYEAMASGCPVYLHKNVEGLEMIGVAMVAAGAAEWHTEAGHASALNGQFPNSHKMIDGLGADRLVAAIL